MNFPYVNTAYVIFYTIIFIVFKHQNMDEDKYVFDNRKLASEPYRLITSSVLHANLEHLLGNLTFQLIIGSALESIIRFRIIILIIIIAGIKGVLLCIFEENILIIGASGIVNGFGGFLIGYCIIYLCNVKMVLKFLDFKFFKFNMVIIVGGTLVAVIAAIPYDIYAWNIDDGIAHKSHVFSFFVGLLTFFTVNSFNFKEKTIVMKTAQTQTSIEIIIV